MKTEKIKLPKIIGALSKNQNCVEIVEAFQHNGTDLIAHRCYEVSEDKMHLLKDEIIMQRHQAVNVARMLLEADALFEKYSVQPQSNRKKNPVRKTIRVKVKPRTPETKAD